MNVSRLIYVSLPSNLVLLVCLQNDKELLEMNRALMARLRICICSLLTLRRFDDGLGLMLPYIGGAFSRNANSKIPPISKAKINNVCFCRYSILT